uniref:Uncharacterized protein n=1 Tax=Steinernema glaseri TaxID=37863 RepID=A0A1I8AK85_9BILA
MDLIGESREARTKVLPSSREIRISAKKGRVGGAEIERPATAVTWPRAAETMRMQTGEGAKVCDEKVDDAEEATSPELMTSDNRPASPMLLGSRWEAKRDRLLRLRRRKPVAAGAQSMPNR